MKAASLRLSAKLNTPGMAPAVLPAIRDEPLECNSSRAAMTAPVVMARMGDFIRCWKDGPPGKLR